MSCRCGPSSCGSSAADGDGHIAGMVKAVMPLGPHVVYEVEIAGGTSLKVSEPREAAPHARSRATTHHVAVSVAPASCHVFPAA